MTIATVKPRCVPQTSRSSCGTYRSASRRSRNDGFSPGFSLGRPRRPRDGPVTTIFTPMPNANGGRKPQRIGRWSDRAGTTRARSPRGRDYFGRYFAGMGLSGRSLSQKMVTTYQRFPSFSSWMLLMPRENGFASCAVRLDS